jgi:hypothetical protein
LKITLDSGRLDQVSFNQKTGEVRLTLRQDAGVEAARLHLEPGDKYEIVKGAEFKLDAGFHVIPFTSTKQEITLKPTKA